MMETSEGDPEVARDFKEASGRGQAMLTTATRGDSLGNAAPQKRGSSKLQRDLAKDAEPCLQAPPEPGAESC